MELRPDQSPAHRPLRLGRTQKDPSQVRLACAGCGAHLYADRSDRAAACGNCGCRDLGPLPPGSPRA